MDRAFTVSQPTGLSEEKQWNPFHLEAGLPREGQQFEYVPMAVMLLKTQETYPLLLSDYSLDGDTATLEMNEWFTWTNGDDVTAQDLATQLYLSKEMGFSTTNAVTEVNQTGDYSVEVTLESERNAILFWTQFMNYGGTRPTRLFTPHSVFGEYREKFEDATTESEKEDIVDELGTWKWQEEPIGYGPYHLNPDRTTQEKMFYERNDDYPVAEVQQHFADALDYDVSDWPDENQIPEIEVVYSGERKTELVLSDTLDASGITTITPELRNQSPGHMEFVSLPVFSGTCFVPNLTNEHFSRRRVRQAVAHLIPFEQAGEIMYGDLAQPVELQTALTKSQEELWLSDDLRSNLNTYDQDEEKAAELLREEGFSREDGTWYDGDGNEVVGGSIPIPASLSQKVKAFDAIAQRLTDFGIETSLSTSDWSGYSSNLNDRNYEGFGHGYMGGGPHPYNAFVPSFGETWWRGQKEWYAEEEVEVPAIDNPDETMSVNPVSLMSELEKDIPEEEQRELVEQLAWVYNHELPLIGLTFKDAATMRTTDHWKMPPADDKMSKNRGARYLQLYVGLLQPKFKN